MTLYIQTSGELTIKNLDAVQKAIWAAREKWFYIGLEFGIDPDALFVIQEKNNDKVEPCLKAMLTEWLKQGKKSWTDVAEALKSPVVGKARLGEEVSEKYCK